MGMQFLLRNGTSCLVDDQDADVTLFEWYLVGGKGSLGIYAGRRSIGNATTIYLHRLIAWRMGLLASLEPTKGLRGRWISSIDHIDGDKLNNQRSNLRLLTRAEQMTNLNDGLRSTNTSGYRGVSFIAKQGAWMAYANVAGKTKSLGTFPTPEQANEARKAWEAGTWVPPAPEQRLCACGCGEPVTSPGGSKPRAYVNANHAEAALRRRKWTAEHGDRPSEPQFCSCGCGDATPFNPRNGHPCMYVNRTHAQRAHRAKLKQQEEAAA